MRTNGVPVCTQTGDGLCYVQRGDISPELATTYMLLSHCRNMGECSFVTKRNSRSQLASIRRLLPLYDDRKVGGHAYVDTLALMRCPRLLRVIATEVAERARSMNADVIVAFETRAMAFATIAAFAAGCAFVAARKEAHGLHLQSSTVRDERSYRVNCNIVVDDSAFKAGDRVVLFDDVLSSGSTLDTLQKLLSDKLPQRAAVVGRILLSSFLDVSSCPTPTVVLVPLY
jgi:adenine/guanine phosphoribosyltransferase-like PRPP-binding protein